MQKNSRHIEPNQDLIKKFLLSLSLSNLVLFDVWKRLFLTDHSRFKLFLPKSPEPYWSALICLFLFSLVIFIPLVTLKRVPRLRILLILLVFSIPANCLRLLMGLQNAGDGNFFFLIPIILAAITILFLLWSYPHWLETKLYLALTIALPCVVCNIGVTVWNVASRDFTPPIHHATKKGMRPNHKVIMLLFDGVDFRHAFVDSHKLKNFETLRGESLYATAAVSPTDRTVGSVGTYLLGTAQHSFEYLNQPINSSLFSELRGMQKRSAIIGWYLPYCRMFGEDLRECVSLCTSGYCQLQYSRKIWKNVLNFISYTLQYSRIKPWVGYNATNDRLIEVAKHVVTASDIDFAFIHLPVPHEPWISRTKPTNDVEGYEGNLQIADQALGEFIQTLKSSNEWDDTTLIVTSDHWWREAPLHLGRKDERIPFFVKLGSNKTNPGTEFVRPFNTVISYELVKSLLRNEITSQAALVDWLSKNAKPSEPFHFFHPKHGTSVIH